MKQSRQTKRTLVLSVLSVVLCLAMLIGTTFAWFTDTASASVQDVKTGTLLVDLEYKNSNGDWESANGKTLNFLKAEGAPTDEAILWEPGCTFELPELRVVNNGTLALKYQLTITGIDGNAKLNEVIDWTINDTDIALTEEYLAAKEEGKSFTLKGHMQETAGNEYQDLTITGITIAVSATQDTVEYDSTGKDYDASAEYPVAASGSVAAEGDTLLQDRESEPTITALIPAGSTNATSLSLTKTTGTTPANLEVVSGTGAITANISLTDAQGNAVTANEGKFFTLTLQLEKDKNVIGFYHNGIAMTKAASAEAVKAANDTWYYDSASGVLTFSTDDFSPFTIVTSESDYNGGTGTEADPYLIATGEQALLMKNKSGYFKLVADVVVTGEVYLSSKTWVIDLNGHSIKLEYADGVKPNNGSTLYIGGKKGKLTINDSSKDQTGAVIGSDQDFSNMDKVFSAVRVGNYGTLTINGGHFYGMNKGTSCIFVMTSASTSTKATVTINGGKFEVASPLNETYFVLNHQDSASAGCTITVNGGSFKNYEPGVTVVDPVNAKTGKITLGTGCTTTQDGEWYTVTKN